MNFIYKLSTIILLINTIHARDFWWNKSYDISEADDYGHQIIQLSDTSIFLTGTSHLKSGKALTTLFKLTKNGDTLWTKQIESQLSYTEKPSAIEMNDNSILIGGHSQYHTGENTYDTKLINLSTNGQTNWSTQFDYDKNDLTPYFINLPNGDLLAASLTAQNGSNNICITKISSSGTPIWSKKIERVGDETIPRLTQLSDNNIVLSFIYRSDPEKYDDNLVFRQIDTIGNLVSESKIQRSFLNYSIYKKSNNNLIVAGFPFNEDLQERCLTVFSLDSSFNISWEKHFDNVKNFSNFTSNSSILELEDKTILVAGSSSADNSSDIVVHKLDRNGNKIWQKRFGGTLAEESPNLLYSSDRSIILSCISKSFGAGDWDFWLQSLPPTQYCSQTNPLKFKISSDKEDSPQYVYALLEGAPEGMTISQDAIIEWKPENDSIELKHIKFLRALNDTHRDTLWFDVWANKGNPITPVIESDAVSQTPSQIDIASNSKSIKITSPNPINGAKLYSLNGKLLLTFVSTNEVHDFNLSANNIASGHYILRVKTNNEILNKRIYISK